MDGRAGGKTSQDDEATPESSDTRIAVGAVTLVRGGPDRRFGAADRQLANRSIGA